MNHEPVRSQGQSLFNDKKKYWSSLAFLAALFALTILLLFRDCNPKELVANIKQANPLFLLAGLGIMFCYISCESLNTKRIMATFNQKLSLWQCLKYAFIGFYFCAITPSATGGQPAQIYYMRKDKIPVAFSTLTLLINLAIYQIVTLLCGLIFFFWKKEFILTSIAGLGPLLWLGITIYLVALAAILTAIFSQTLMKRIFYVLIRLGVTCKFIKDVTATQKKADQQLQEYQAGVTHIKKHPRLLVGNFLITLIQLLCYFSIPYFVYLAFHLSAYSLWDMIALQTILTISVSALPLPGAVGASEGGFLIVFQLFFTSGLLLPAMMLTRGINFYTFLMISGIIAIFTHWKTNRMITIP